MCHRCLSLASVLMASALAATETIVSPDHPHHDGKLLTDETRHDVAELLHLMAPAMDANAKVDQDRLTTMFARIGVMRMHLAFSVAGYMEGAMSAARAHFSKGIRTAADAGDVLAQSILAGGSPSPSISVVVLDMSQKKPSDPTSDFMRPLGASRLN